jgi:hypothetical protein
MVWWSRKGDQATKQRDQEKSLLRTLSGAWRKAVIHVFDRGYASGPWLGYLGAFEALLVIRWKKAPHFLDGNGKEMALSQIIGRTRSKWQKELWNFQKRGLRKTGIVVKRVRHAQYAGDVWVGAVRKRGAMVSYHQNPGRDRERSMGDCLCLSRALEDRNVFSLWKM